MGTVMTDPRRSCCLVGLTIMEDMVEGTSTIIIRIRTATHGTITTIGIRGRHTDTDNTIIITITTMVAATTTGGIMEGGIE